MRSLVLIALVATVGCGSEDTKNGAGASSGGSSSGFQTNDGGPGAGDGGNGCGPNLTGILRDFRANGTPGGHPDFENYNNGLATGLVEATLGSDRKPVFKSTTG